VVSGLNHYAHGGDDVSNDPPNKYSSWFKSKLREIDQLSASSPRNGLRFFFDSLEYIGTYVEFGALALAPITDGASLAFVPVGFQINTAGVIGNTAIDVYDGQYRAGAFRLLKHGVFFGLGKALKHFGGFDDYFVKPLEVHMNQGIDSLIDPKSSLLPIDYQLDKNYNLKR
jgi:hypothetical protein